MVSTDSPRRRRTALGDDHAQLASIGGGAGVVSERKVAAPKLTTALAR
jgi:hypothetical protein